MRINLSIVAAAVAVLGSGLPSTGCGTAFPTHEIEVVLSDLPSGVTLDDCVVIVTEIDINEKEELAAQTRNTGQAGPDGRVRIEFRSTAATWLWQRRPSSLTFHLFLPRIQTNGWYYVHLPELPCKPAPVQGLFQDYETWWQNKFPDPLPTLPITAEATRSRKFSDGYRVVLHVSVARLLS